MMTSSGSSHCTCGVDACHDDAHHGYVHIHVPLSTPFNRVYTCTMCVVSGYRVSLSLQDLSTSEVPPQILGRSQEISGDLWRCGVFKVMLPVMVVCRWCPGGVCTTTCIPFIHPLHVVYVVYGVDVVDVEVSRWVPCPDDLVQNPHFGRSPKT